MSETAAPPIESRADSGKQAGSGKQASDWQFIRSLVLDRPTKRPNPSIADYVHHRRVMPSNTPFPGPYSVDRTPYVREILDALAPNSGVEHVAWLKAAQVSATTAAENVILYYMDENPTEILMISGSESLLDRWSTKRLEPAIDSIGIRHKIYATTTPQGSRRKGDRAFSKQFIGGALDMSSAQSPAGQRAESKRVLIRDEIDAAPPSLQTGEGRWLAVSYARTAAWGNRRKVFDMSTPTTYVQSQIWRQYERGDQRVYLVPCPHCRTEQELKWFWDRDDIGLRPVYDEHGRLIDAVYVCPECGEEIRNTHKTWMLARGYWKPTAIAQEMGYRSYHLSALYAPVGMRSWREIYQRYLAGLDDPDEMRAFVNLDLGLPYREEGARPKLDKVMSLAGDYPRGTVPYGVLYLTLGCDVQRGSATDPANPPRLEAQVMGHGAGYRSWAIEYLRFEGDIDDPYGGAWEAMHAYAEETGLKYRRKDGQEFQVRLAFIDSRDGNMTATVEAFCERWQNTFPIMGMDQIKRRKNEAPDADLPSSGDFKRYRLQRIGSGEAYYYQIGVSRYKSLIYSRLRHSEVRPGDVPKPGSLSFPRDFDEVYFRMLTAEERLADGSFHAGGRRNEALDTAVYAMAASDVHFDGAVSRLQETLRKQRGMQELSPEDAKKLVLQRWSRDVGVEFPLAPPNRGVSAH